MRQLEPKVVLPMHYKTETLARALASVDRFLGEMGVPEISFRPRLSLSKANLPVSTQVFLLDY